MTNSFLLDTTVVVAHFRRNDSITQHLLDADFLYLPVIALGELLHGVHRLPFPEREMTKIKSFLGAVTILGLGTTTADQFGQISAHLSAEGKPIPTNDVWIAALAREHGLPLATRDHHFDRVPQIQVLQW